MLVMILSSHLAVEDVTRRSAPRQPRGANRSSTPHFKGKQQNHRDTCTRCGRRKHAAGETCPALGVTCHKCNRKGHFKAQCLSKTVATLQTQEDDSAFLDAAYLGMVHTQPSSVWMTSVKLGGTPTEFKLDTGAEVTAISERTYNSLQGVTLQPATKSLYGPANQALKVLGQFKGNLAHKEHSLLETVYVVRGLRNNLLGLGAIERLQLIK